MKDLIEALNRAHKLDEAHKALNRDDVYQYLFKLLQDDDMNHFIFTTCKNIAKKYKIDVSPYWPLDKILDRFTDEQLAEVLQTVEEYSSIPANDQRDESWINYAARRLDDDPENFLDEMFAKFAEEAYAIVEAEGYTDVFTEPSTQAGRGGDFFWAEKDGVSYRGNYDFETEQEEMSDCCLNADSEEEAIELCAKKYASIILSSLKPEVDDLEEAAFSGGMAGDNSASGGTIRGRGASTQPGKNNYLNRMKNKNPDLVDTMVIKVSDIKPGMITQAGQVKEAEARNHPSGGKKMYIMHTNGYDGFWGLDETMDVMVDPENKSKPFAGDYRSLLKMGLQESSTSIDVFAEAKNRMPFVTSTSGTNENFEIVFEDDMTGDTFYIRGKLVDNRYNVQVEVHENRRSLWGYRTSVHFWNMNPLAPKSLCTLFDRWNRAYLADGQTSGHMRLGPVFKGWNASLRLSHDS